MMVWQKKGLCGCDIKMQTYFIAGMFLVGSLVGMISGFMLMGDPEDFLSAHGHELQLQVEKETKEEMKVLSKPQNFTSPMASMEVQTSDQEEERAIHAVAEREEEDSKLNDTTLVKGFESVFNTPEYRLEMKMIKEVQHKGIEMVVGSIVTTLFTSMLIHGVRKSQSAWFLPWLAQQTAELCFFVGFFLIYSVTGVNFSVPQGWTDGGIQLIFTKIKSFLSAVSTYFVCFYLIRIICKFVKILECRRPPRPLHQILMALVSISIASFFLYAVFSHYILLRRMKRHTTAIISSVMDSESYSAAGVNYERLQEEVMAAGAADNTSNTKEMTPMPSTATEPAAAAAGATATATATGKRETALNRDDMMYFSI